MEGGKAAIRTAIKLNERGEPIGESQEVEAGSFVKLGEIIPLPEKSKEAPIVNVPETTKSSAKIMKAINLEEVKKDIEKLYEKK